MSQAAVEYWISKEFSNISNISNIKTFRNIRTIKKTEGILMVGPLGTPFGKDSLSKWLQALVQGSPGQPPPPHRA